MEDNKTISKTPTNAAVANTVRCLNYRVVAMPFSLRNQSYTLAVTMCVYYSLVPWFFFLYLKPDLRAMDSWIQFLYLICTITDIFHFLLSLLLFIGIYKRMHQVLSCFIFFTILSIVVYLAVVFWTIPLTHSLKYNMCCFGDLIIRLSITFFPMDVLRSYRLEITSSIQGRTPNQIRTV